ncbi:GtrA family protein [Mycobacterium avium subsp. paratuberculosis]|uniref:GtrA family protein n=1 Tax=Mycobacterium avium TaxID=1764 RepID=UPI0003D20F62|nr:GtrA family protein [Mycobacterium avium]ETB06248.1 membrane protein [Mycobacterium avium subsp. paratuberculosis 10-4404]ETB35988.1 membrane protein [Mycobacterium avium subsp. paratuberculosis 10-5975]AZA69955.1 GtrA family protein [Mycobacterium avium subsp. paratuberculosis]AZB15535.1 GtrA family protein [Mycobacterium avium subsp. paratuberculosis]AZB39565.1 GtrA family protein [Mycobacterium avium subsp. paratuberculosis]
MSFAEATIARLPRLLQPYLLRHHELIKFAIVGGTTFVIDSAIFYTLKLTILETKPVTAKVIAGIVAVIASYVLNREWSFRNRGGRERHHEALLFFAFSGVGVLLSMAPLWFSSYVLQLRQPTVSLTVENVADFISAYIIGNLLQMAFRFWAFRRWVFPDQFARDPDKALESALTAGGIAEIFEDAFEDDGGNVTLLRAWRNRAGRLTQLGDSSEPRVSKTS